MKNEHAQLRGMTRGPWRANEQGCAPTMGLAMRGENGDHDDYLLYVWVLWGRPPHDFTKASVLVLTKHARKITMHLTAEKTSLHTLPIRQLFDAGNSLIRRETDARTGPRL